MKIVDATGLVSIKIVGAIGLDGLVHIYGFLRFAGR